MHRRIFHDFRRSITGYMYLPIYTVVECLLFSYAPVVGDAAEVAPTKPTAETKK